MQKRTEFYFYDLNDTEINEIINYPPKGILSDLMMNMKKENPYDRWYIDQESYWGKRPSKMCKKVLEFLRPSPNFHPKLLDIGCGEGRNAIYFAKHGFKVCGLDISRPGLQKTRRYAEKAGVHVETTHANIITYVPEDMYMVIFSTGTLHYLPPDVRPHWFQQYKDVTFLEGIHAHSVLVTKPFIDPAPDAEENSYLYPSGEVMNYYLDWEILYFTEEIFDCKSSGVPHQHAINRIVAKKVE